MILWGITILIVLIAAYVLLIVPTRWLRIEHVHYPEAKLGIRILQISDIHAERTRITPEKLVHVIETLRPDYICVTGDFTEKAVHLPKVKRYAEAIASAGIPVYAVLGNHDYRLESKLPQLMNLLTASGFKVLVNESVLVDGRMRFVGIDDHSSRRSNFEAAFAQVEPNMPTVVLTHDPTAVLIIQRPFHYFMAGHFHGMQVNIPPLFRFVNKGGLVEAGVYKGLHHTRNGPFYISAGIGQAGINARFLVRTEVTLHEL
ncbi:metallophosphoesterase [Paenibacillus kobensis]|uniref:metallophosphoesterase n=1 Tax=Paenibacillus kobensis TaxID=59841 RepID=UPI000FDB784C|nr:metallophosphoesterase [Paenibacillus kobensis]